MIRPKLNDPSVVAAQYASEGNLEARRSIYANTEGPDPREVAFEAVAETSPARVIEVGGGPGELAARIRDEVGAEVVMVDISPRMVALARERGVDARIGDVEELPFEDASFDCALAAWMLFHLPDLDRGLAELARVLRPSGRLVAVTNGKNHLLELWRLVGAEHLRPTRDLAFGAENGEQILCRHFRQVEIRDAGGTVTVTNRDAVARFLDSTDAGKELVNRLPEQIAPFTARRSSVVFVADK